MIDERKPLRLKLARPSRYNEVDTNKITITPIMSPTEHVLKLIELREIPKVIKDHKSTWPPYILEDGNLQVEFHTVCKTSLSYINMAEFLIISQELGCRFSVSKRPFLITYDETPKAYTKPERMLSTRLSQREEIETTYRGMANLLTQYSGVENYLNFLPFAHGHYLVKINGFPGIVTAEHLKKTFAPMLKEWEDAQSK